MQDACVPHFTKEDVVSVNSHARFDELHLLVTVDQVVATADNR